MLSYIKKNIESTKLHLNPFPHIVIKNLLPKLTLNKLNKTLPSFNEVSSKYVIFQSSSKTKKTIMPDSEIFKKMLREKTFYEVNSTLQKIKPLILKKFKSEIEKNVSPNFVKSKIEYNMNFALMKKGYLKSAHLDRRDHLISGIYYPKSEKNKGGNLLMCGVKKKGRTFDVFPSKKNLKISKNYKINENFCVFFLNVPWAYHAVSKYNGKSDRKYFYIDYDFKLKKSSSSSINRKKGLNQNSFWNTSVIVKSENRKKIFFEE